MRCYMNRIDGEGIRQMAIGSRRAGAQNYEALRRARAELLEAQAADENCRHRSAARARKACGRSRMGDGADRRVEGLLTEGM